MARWGWQQFYTSRDQSPAWHSFTWAHSQSNMVYKAEVVGVLLSLHLLSKEHWVSRAIIMLDNQAVIAALSSCKPKPTQSIIDGILSQAEACGREWNIQIFVWK